MVDISFVTNALVFAFLGVVIFWVSFLVIDLITPYKLWKELIDEITPPLRSLWGDVSGYLPHHSRGHPRLSPGHGLCLLISVFVIASCGLVYELIAGTLASYLLGDSVIYFRRLSEPTSLPWASDLTSLAISARDSSFASFALR